MESSLILTIKEKYWINQGAKNIAYEIFQAIDEQRFSVLYSDKTSRPNAPVKVIVDARIIKELFDCFDDLIGESYAGPPSSIRVIYDKFYRVVDLT